jgi:hypothetical protein
MRRVGKLMYEWVGFSHLPTLLEQLAEDEANGVPVEDRIRRAPTLIIVNEQGEEIGSGKGNSHSLWVLSRRLVRMLLKQQGPIALTAAAAVLVGPGGVADPSKHRSQTQITVERRLYDIGSILCSVGLLERIYMKKRWGRCSTCCVLLLLLNLLCAAAPPPSCCLLPLLHAAVCAAGSLHTLRSGG